MGWLEMLGIGRSGQPATRSPYGQATDQLEQMRKMGQAFRPATQYPDITGNEEPITGPRTGPRPLPPHMIPLGDMPEMYPRQLGPLPPHMIPLDELERLGGMRKAGSSPLSNAMRGR